MDDESAQRLAQVLFDTDPDGDRSVFPSIPGYVLHKVIGQGGGGVVLEGVVESTARPVAVKVLHPRTTRSVAQALSELDRLAAVRSPVVPHVFEHGWIGNQLYIVTELIEGKDPVTYAKERTLRQKVALLARIADAVATLSARGIIHRDLKPSNILITDEGNPVILDLGIATILDDGHAQKQPRPETLDDTPIGTAAYMSPEQAMGKNDEVSTRWDVYAIGAIAYKVLTGSTPHGDAPTVTAALDASAQQPLIPPRSLNPALPKQLETILLTACAQDPSQRYENPQQLRDDLNRWLNKEPIAAGRQSPWARSIRALTRHPILTTTAAVLIIIVASTVSMYIFVRWQGFQAYQFGMHAGSGKITVTSLYSRSGRIIHTWESREENGIRFAGRLVNYKRARYAILGFATPDTHGDNGLVGYRVGYYDKPAWTATQHIPPALRYAARYRPEPDLFIFRKIYFMDVFPDEPGPELVSVHCYSPLSPCAIQIHRADGKLLSEYYHDGYITSLYFDPINTIMYAAAQNSDGKWTDRGEDTLPPEKYPIVVFAFRPQLGALQQVIRHPGLGLGTEPLWYKCLLPARAYSTVLRNYSEVGIALKQPHQFAQQKSGDIEIQLGAGIIAGTSGQVDLIVSPDGEILESWANDSWTGTDLGWTPDIFTLGDLPPRTTPRKYEPSETPPASVPSSEPQAP